MFVVVMVAILVAFVTFVVVMAFMVIVSVVVTFMVVIMLDLTAIRLAIDLHDHPRIRSFFIQMFGQFFVI